MLLAAVLMTGAVAFVAMSPDERGAYSRTVADDVESPGSDWLHGGFTSLRERVRAVDVADNDTHQKSKGGGATVSAELPARSGSGRRVVFDISGQRVWIVGADERVRSTYLVSGSRSDNLNPGRYEVFSRSRNAVGYGGHSTMEYFVRFARGANSNIGFHDIPVNHAGKPIQSLDDLGTPQSAGCIRQKRADAKRMWRFAHEGTEVVVVA